MNIYLNDTDTQSIITSLRGNYFDALSTALVLDQIFNGYLWSQHVQNIDDAQEAQHYHQTLIEVKTLLSIICPLVKEVYEKTKGE